MHRYWYQGKHEPLVTKEQFDKVQEQLKRDSIVRQSRELAGSVRRTSRRRALIRTAGISCGSRVRCRRRRCVGPQQQSEIRRLLGRGL
jgi:hypothetical protein